MAIRRRKLSRREMLTYISVLCFITAQYVVDMEPWQHIFRIAGLLALLGSMMLLFFDSGNEGPVAG